MAATYKIRLTKEGQANCYSLCKHIKISLGQSFLIFRFTVLPTNDFLVLEKK